MAGEWIPQLPEDLRANEAFTGFATLGDFAKSYLEVKGKAEGFEGKVKEHEGKIGDLEGKLKTNYIPKVTEKSKPEEVTAYRKAIGVPDKMEEYEFPKLEGKENDPAMESWARKTFHEIGVPKEMAKALGGKWNEFMNGVVAEEDRLVGEERTKAESEFRKTFKNEEEYKAGYELATRFWEKATGTKFNDLYKEADVWMVPGMMAFIFGVAKMMGGDYSPTGRTPQEGKKEGIIYDKSPAPPPK